MVQFNKHLVKNTENGAKARVHYSYSDSIITKGNIVKQLEHVMIYAKDYIGDLEKVFGAMAQNDSDMMTDYFETSRVRICKGDPMYADALAMCQGLTAGV